MKRINNLSICFAVKKSTFIICFPATFLKIWTSLHPLALSPILASISYPPVTLDLKARLFPMSWARVTSVLFKGICHLAAGELYIQKLSQQNFFLQNIFIQRLFIQNLFHTEVIHTQRLYPQHNIHTRVFSHTTFIIHTILHAEVIPTCNILSKNWKGIFLPWTEHFHTEHFDAEFIPTRFFSYRGYSYTEIKPTKQYSCTNFCRGYSNMKHFLKN